MLKSNKVEDIQNFLELWRSEIDKQYRLLWEDINTIQVDGDGWIYFGGKNAVGSARIGLVGTDWEVQLFISGAYTARLEAVV